MTDLIQDVVDGLGRGSVYALLALGIAVIFGVMHLVNFAHGELITVGAYVAYWSLGRWELNWWWAAGLVVVAAVGTSVAIEFVAFRWVRGGSEFTLLLTSFGVHFVVQAIFVMYVSASVRNFSRPGWVADVWTLGGVRIEVFEVLTIAVTVVTLVATMVLLQRTMFGVSLRAAAEDFDAARLMGIRSDRVIRWAFILAGFLAGIAAVSLLMRNGSARPNTGLSPMLKGVLAAIIGGLGSMPGAVVGGFALGLGEVFLHSWLPEDLVGITDGVVFLLIAVLFIFRPQGLFTVRAAERV